MSLFVDTGAWFAASVPGDDDHRAASVFLRSNRERLITTDFIYDELLTLFRRRGQFHRAADWVEQVRQKRCEMVQVTDADIRDATKVYFQFSDKKWSFTDCTSRVVMERLGIDRAFSFDEHFRQFGTVTVVPQPVR